MASSDNIKLKRVYEPEEPSDGVRILVERLWPRGLSKEKAHVDYWSKKVAPSTVLRKWYNHQLERWPDFRRKYIEELQNNSDAVSELRQQCHGRHVTFVFAAQDEAHSSAVVLKEFMTKDEKSIQ